MKKINFLLFLISLLCSGSLLAGSNTNVSPTNFVDMFNAAADGDTLLLASGTYSTAIAFPTAKSVTLKAAPGSTVKPVITFQIGDPTGAGGSLTFIGVSINRNGDYFYSTATTYNIGSLKFINCEISNIAKSLINTSTSGGTMNSVLIDNCIVSSCGTSGTNFITMYYILGSISVTNSTINNFKGGNFFNSKQSTTGTALIVNYTNNTFYKCVANNGWALCSLEGGGYSLPNQTFNNNILDGAAGSVSPRIIYTKSGGTVSENRNIIIGYQSDYIQGTNTTTRDNLTLGSGLLATVSTIPYNSAATGDFSIPETSPIATSGVNGVCVGDPRWIKKVLTPATITTVSSPAGAGSVSPASLTVNMNDKVTVSTTPNFGYHFLNWTDESGNVISTSTEFQFTLSSASTRLTANYQSVDTYSLDLSLTGGANNYMVAVSPAGTVVNGKRMYESGTTVTLTAANNPIMTFSNWSTGETSPSLSFTMNKNQTINAVYNAKDYIVGWDFYKTGGQSRIADFYSSDENAISALVMRKEDGSTNSWLDKSIAAANGYYERGAAVKWKNLTDKYYYQISFDATSFKDISVKSSMLLNYNGHTKQIVQFSTNNTDFTPLDTIEITSTQGWFDNTVSLPSSVNNASKIYIRWIPDYSSTIMGSTSDYDGAAISSIYILGTNVPPVEFVPPVLLSTVPATAATNASTTGNIVLNFDEKIKLTGSTVVGVINGKQITPTVAGKTMIFSYAGLQYNTQYTFILAAGSVADLYDNTLNTAINITFTTMNRPVVVKKSFDFVVGVNGNFKAALDAATAASSTGNRFYIFFPNGEYNIGTLTGDGNQMTTISLPNVSYIGQDADKVVLYNKNTAEGMGVTATLNFTSTANNLYLQDLSIKNGDYRSGTSSLGRCLALYDNGTKNIFKNVNVLSNQDTYFSASGRKYFEGGSIHGTVDYIFGGGDVFFNESLLYMEGSGYIAAPNTTTSTSWGYVFNNCTIDGVSSVNGNYRLGRPWQNSPKAVFLNTVMKVLPAAEGWSDWYTSPSVFAEYNSTTLTGTSVDISMRRTTYGSTTVNPILTAAQAATYTVDNVLTGTDGWQPRVFTDQAAAPYVTISGKTLNWANSNYVLCWAIFLNNTFVEFVTTNSYTIPLALSDGVYTVRAANEMGGLSLKSNEVAVTSTSARNAETDKINIFCSGNNILIKGLVGTTKIEILTIDGKKIFTSTSVTDIFSYKIINKGIYVVKLNGLSYKIVCS